jgi:membrane protease YdiL (CAAX protease family)
MIETIDRHEAAVVRRIAPLWHGHVFVFDGPIEPPAYANTKGVRLLALAVVLEVFRIATNIAGSAVPTFRFWAPLIVFLAFACLRRLGFSGRQMGLRPWRKWNATEKWYFVQTLILTNVIFPAVFAAQLSRAFSQSTGPAFVGTFIAYLFSGFFQELLYRGMLQMELTRRWGPFAGILVSNLLYTFVQHYYYFGFAASLAVPMFAAVFAVGLLFAMVFWRSGNLWIVGVMHAFGNAYIVTTFGRLS